MKTIAKAISVILMSIIILAGVQAPATANTDQLNQSEHIILSDASSIGVATAIAECEDNGEENGYYMYCETERGDKLFVPMEDVLPGDRFVYDAEGTDGNVLTILNE